MGKYVLFFLVLISMPLYGQKNSADYRKDTKSVFSKEAARIKEASDGSLTLIRSSVSGSPQLIRATVSMGTPIVSGSSRESETEVSSAVVTYMNTIGRSVLGFAPESSTTLLATSRVGTAWHSAFSVRYNNIRLRDRTAHIHTGAITGKVVLIRSDIPTVLPNTTIAEISALRSAEIAKKVYSNDRDIVPYSSIEAPTLVYVNLPTPAEVRLAWETILSDGFHQWRYTIDAVTGSILEIRDMVICNISMDDIAPASYPELSQPSQNEEVLPTIQSSNDRPLQALVGRVLAKVHLTKPTDTLTTVGLGGVYITVNSQQYITDSLGNWSATTTYPVTLSTRFSGPYFVTHLKDGQSDGAISKTIQSGSLDLLWDDSNSDPAERDVCYAVNVARDHVLRVDTGLKEINQRLTLNVNLPQTCNAFYEPGSRSLNFFAKGGSCANTAEIADVVAHEFGHRINHVRYQKAGKDYMFDKSLDEGFADLSSNFLRDDPVIGKGFYGNNSTLRNSNNAKIWPKDISPDGHETGSMIAGAVWDLRNLIGHDVAEQLYNLCGYQTPDGTGFNDPNSIADMVSDVLTAFLITDDNDNDLANGTPHAAEILTAFQRHNLGIQQYFDLNIIPVPDATASEESYPVTAQAIYSGVIGATNDTMVTIHYSIDNGKTYSTQRLSPIGNDQFAGAIEKVPQYSIVKYYLTAGTNYANAGVAKFPIFDTFPFSFVVGYDSKWIDNCETDNGWTKTGSASTGLWSLEKPIGTFDEHSYAIQQDSDHSVDGTMCFLTGNNATGDVFSASVSGGSVTLTSPLIDLSGLNNPVIRFWYYYSNDQSLFGGAPFWKMQVSSNGSSSYKTLNSPGTSMGSQISSKGWKPVAFRVKDVFSGTISGIKLRFIATDVVPKQTYPDQTPIVGIVEAGVDDIEVLDHLGLGVATPIVAASDLLYPNPVEAGKRVTVAITGSAISGPITYRLYNTLGRLISEGELQRTSAGASFVTPSTIAAGAYQLLIKSGESIRNDYLIIRSH